MNSDPLFHGNLAATPLTPASLTPMSQQLDDDQIQGLQL